MTNIQPEMGLERASRFILYLQWEYLLITMNLYGHVFPSMLDEVVEKWNREFHAE
jgi:hypothetical protein